MSAQFGCESEPDHVARPKGRAKAIWWYEVALPAHELRAERPDPPVREARGAEEQVGAGCSSNTALASGCALSPEAAKRTC